jgi:transposase
VQPFSQVADAESVSGYRVLEAFEDYADRELDHPVEPPRVISLDESSFKRRFCFHTVLSDPERGKLLGMVEGRDKRGAISALGLLEPGVRAAVQTVVIDCHWPFRQAAELMMPGARIVADKFHVIRSVDQAAQRVRVRVGRRPKHMMVGRDGGTARQKYPRGEPLLYRSRWVFMKRAGKLTDRDRQWLEAVFESSPEMRLAWLIKESFAAIYDSPDRQEAERRLDAWVYNLDSCGMREFADVWRTLQWWREPILAYFEDRVTNGFAEGITNKIKVMKRMSYGFRNAERYQRKVLLMSARRRSRGPEHRKS